MAIAERGQAGGGGKGQAVTKNRGETIYLKDFEVVKSWRYFMGIRAYLYPFVPARKN